MVFDCPSTMAGNRNASAAAIFVALMIEREVQVGGCSSSAVSV
jgi:hypothetical protein